ncbi:uncharacterized protein LOC121428627 [Lytechinus variegatus]|uniref:uncharacterized protein LOC121428627 n=1 Tax=Lytechinus variegatus TaxID=7654 RepID=UPI001BB0E91B|nr:uncharacterized protein LOC121428627 [Lytechinus variegatus]
MFKMSSSYISRCVVFIYFLVDLTCPVLGQECHHLPVKLTSNDRMHVVRPNTQSRILSPDKRMKIHVEYHQSLLEHPKAQDVQNAVAEVVDRMSRTLSVKQEPGYFQFKTYCESPQHQININGQPYCTVSSCSYSYCGGIMAPPTLSEPCHDCDDGGENCTMSGGPSPNRGAVHYVLLVSSVDTSCRENFIGYSYACRIDDTTDRPVAGVINFCPIGLALDRTQMMDTIQHEMFHVLGFSSSMYGLYRDARGKPLTPRESNGLPALNQKTFEFEWSDQVIRNFTLDWDYTGGTTQRSVQAFVLPNVLREARAHFGCPSLMGVELEDGGGFGTAMSHFEKRILATESMNGMLTAVRVFSRITLAVMEDTGWYIPDYSMADKLNWGKDLGCDFLLKSCKNWIDTRINSGLSPAPWCSRRNESSCHVEGTDAAVCKIRTYNSPIPAIYQMFTEVDGFEPADLTRIGGNRLADYCPYHEVDRDSPHNLSATDFHCTNTEIIDDCRHNKCTNGGVCRDIMNGYYCDCPNGYSGAFCDYVNGDCATNSDCQMNEVCSSNHGCECVRNRIRDDNGHCIGVTDVQEYTITVRITEVNGVPAVYQPSLTGKSGEGFRNDIEYEIRQMTWNDSVIRGALLNVVTRRVYRGSIMVDLSVILQKNSSSPISLANLAADASMQDSILRKSGTAYTVVPSETVVRDTNECEDGAGNDCSHYAECINTEGSYECSCLPGFTEGTGVLLGRECIDIDECQSSLDNDCSLDAQCINMMGSYNCSCREGYEDGLHSDDRPGRVCHKQAIPSPSSPPGLPPVIIISVSVALGIFFLLAILLIYISFLVRRKRTGPRYNDPPNPRSLNQLPRQDTHTDAKNIRALRSDVSRNPIHNTPLPIYHHEVPHVHRTPDRHLPHDNFELPHSHRKQGRSHSHKDRVWSHPHHNLETNHQLQFSARSIGSSLNSSYSKAYTESTHLSTEPGLCELARDLHSTEACTPHKLGYAPSNRPISHDNHI